MSFPPTSKVKCNSSWPLRLSIDNDDRETYPLFVMLGMQLRDFWMLDQHSTNCATQSHQSPTSSSYRMTLICEVGCWWYFFSMVYHIPAVFAEAPWSTQLSFYKRADRNVSTFSTLGIFESLELAILEVCRVQALNSNSELISFPWFGHQNYLKDSGCHPANMLHFRDPSVSCVCLAIWKTIGRSFL